MITNPLLSTTRSLSNMIREMNRKNLDLHRITKTASLMIMSGTSPNSIPTPIIERCINEQRNDGGWVSVVDTLWNACFLNLVKPHGYDQHIERAFHFLRDQSNENGLWGRSRRDMSRIPVTGILFYLFPQFADEEKCFLLEQLWTSEANSLTYKAAYTLMACNAAHYLPRDQRLIPNTVEWLITNQRPDGGFAPWKEHPVSSDVFCTAVATIGLLQYHSSVPPDVFQKSYAWLINHRLPNGIWPYHEIEDGASWGLYALSLLTKPGILK
ncbi:MAG: prenyltransferase/squalene oxidase repeat-containing protein [Candidatus Omnitrophota bacterium]